MMMNMFGCGRRGTQESGQATRGDGTSLLGRKGQFQASRLGG